MKSRFYIIIPEENEIRVHEKNHRKELRNRVYTVEDSPFGMTGLPQFRFFQLLSNNQTINADICRARLEKFKENIAEKRGKLSNRNNVIFHRDIIRLM